jgi:hypothetical protein
MAPPRSREEALDERRVDPPSTERSELSKLRQAQLGHQLYAAAYPELREPLKGFEPSTFCMASRRAGEPAALVEREKPLVPGNCWGASGWVWVRLGQRLGPRELP